MEKRLKIVITGPESTGKTELSIYLAEAFRGDYIPEYARSYIEGLNRPYTFSDVDHIAGVQEREFRESAKMPGRVIFLDTYLIITKVWFLEVYDRMPDWIDMRLKESEIDLFLLCYYDIEWTEDPVRENPGKRREYLFERYKQEIEALGIPYEVIRGNGPTRFANAQRAVLRHFPDITENRI